MKDMDTMLRNALTPSEEPEACLNQKILERAREEKMVRKAWFRKMPAVAAAALAIVMAGSLTTYAAWSYFHPDQVAEEMGEQSLAKAFRGKDAVEINKSQTYGDYKITLVGMVSGKGLCEFAKEYEDQVEEEISYVMVSIAKKDGTDLPKLSESTDAFYVSPFIHGVNPQKLNISYMGGGAQTCVKDGVYYQIAECDSLQKFAGRGVYVGVTRGSLYRANAYQYDASTGEISRNESYNDVNALFELPLDPSKADEKAAEAQIKKWREESQIALDAETGEVLESDGEFSNDTEILDTAWNAERVEKEATRIESTVKTYKESEIDNEGNIQYEWSYKNAGGGGSIPVNVVFEKNQYGMSDQMTLTNGPEPGTVLIETITRNEDGTYTMAMWLAKEKIK